MRPRLLIALALLLTAAPDVSHGSAIDFCELLPQEVRKAARATAILYARPAADADSLGFLARDAQVVVKGCALGWCEIESSLARGFVLDTLLAAVAPAPTSAPASRATPSPDPPPQRRACCRVCRTGKACGDSCIARSLTCRKGAGCACNGSAS
jgi:hypothetical protein